MSGHTLIYWLFTISVPLDRYSVEHEEKMSRHLMTPEHYARIKSANDHYELRVVAESIIALMDDPIGMVCGPISTGGLGTIEANEQQFIAAINRLVVLGHNIFDQMVFEPRMKDLIVETEEYDWRILEHFYEPLFLSGRIRQKFFIPGWQSSTGATWEREQAKKLGITIIDLDSNFNPL